MEVAEFCEAAGWGGMGVGKKVLREIGCCCWMWAVGSWQLAVGKESGEGRVLGREGRGGIYLLGFEII